MAPTIRKASAPVATESGSGESGGSCGQVQFAGEEPQERSARAGDVVAYRPAQHWIAGLERIEDRALRRGTIEAELQLAFEMCECPQMCWKDHSDHGYALVLCHSLIVG